MLACVNGEPLWATSWASRHEADSLRAGSAVISRVYLGVLSDRVSPHIIGALTMAAATLSVLVLWGVTCEPSQPSDPKSARS